LNLFKTTVLATNNQSIDTIQIINDIKLK